MNKNNRPDKNDRSTIHPYQWVEAVKPTATTDYSTLADSLIGPRHDIYQPEGFTGRLVCKLTTVAPLVVGNEHVRQDDVSPADVKAYRDPLTGAPAVPGSSLKGLLSSYIEALSGSALRVLNDAPLVLRDPVREPRKSVSVFMFDPINATSELAFISTIDRSCRSNRYGSKSFRCQKIGLVKRGAIKQVEAVAGAGDWRPYKGTHHKGAIYSVFDPDKHDKDPSGPDFPPGHKYALWLPKPKKDARQLAVSDALLLEFWTLLALRLDDRSSDQTESGSAEPPYFPKGYETGFPRTVSPDNLKAFKQWLHGKIVMHDFNVKAEPAERVARLSFSALWRRFHSARSTRAAFNSEHLPWGAESRGNGDGSALLTPAESLLGVVRDANEKEQGDTTPARLLAGRVRVSDATSEEVIKLDPVVTLRALNSPKPPSPQLYFRGEKGKSRAMGRKFYPPQHSPDGEGAVGQWVKKSLDADVAPKLCLRARPIPIKKSFWFHLDVQNLSAQEFGLLLRAMSPSNGHLHTLGLGKPLGLGAIRLEPVVWCARDVTDAPSAQRLRRTSPFKALQWQGASTQSVPARYSDLRALDASATALETLHDDTLVDNTTLAQLRAVGDRALSRGKLVWYPLTTDKLSATAAETEGFKWAVAARENKDVKRTVQLAYPSKQGLASVDVLRPRSNAQKKGPR